MNECLETLGLEVLVDSGQSRRASEGIVIPTMNELVYSSASS